jgi:hypothetical protein
MRLLLAALCIAASASMAYAQTQPNLDQLSASQPIKGGATSPDDGKGQSQPQGSAGPLTTGSGGTTAASPQGGTPAGMQADPKDSKTSADRK